MRGSKKESRFEPLEDWLTENIDLPVTWKDLSSGVKNALTNSLWREQLGLCIYCGGRININDRIVKPQKHAGRKSYHIEHFWPQRDSGKEIIFSYSNLFLSCGDVYEHDMNPIDLICGSAKGGELDELLYIEPDIDECSSRFYFKDDGTILCADNDSNAIYMISLLNLNDKNLIAFRRRTWESVLDEMASSSLDPTSAEVLEFYESTDATGAQQSYAHMITKLLSTAQDL